MPTTVRSHAKINLGLGIGAPRQDGFHALVTLYQTLELHDLVTVSAHRAAETSISLTSNDDRVPADHRNTAWKMVELALRILDYRADVAIHIDKRLPIQGGLGAGSANAVAALIALEAELGIASETSKAAQEVFPEGGGGFNPRITPADSTGALAPETWPSTRLDLAAQVGSDVPLFLIGGAVLGLDRGQLVYPMPDFAPVWTVVAIPSIGVSTPQAFRDWDALCVREGLTETASVAKLNELSRAYASSLSGVGTWSSSSGVFSKGEDLAGTQVSVLVRTGIANDFERVVFPQHPLLSEIKRTLAAPGTSEAALYASLSGSGSALFGLYQGPEEAEAARERLRGLGVESLVTRTLPRSAYWRQMLLK